MPILGTLAAVRFYFRREIGRMTLAVLGIVLAPCLFCGGILVFWSRSRRILAHCTLTNDRHSSSAINPDDAMHIANPMYDTVFKYLLEDNALAKLLIGTILQEEILSLDFCPQERTQQIERPGERVLTVYRMDFAARVRNADGIERQVLIELQKAKFATDILRFRAGRGMTSII